MDLRQAAQQALEALESDPDAMVKVTECHWDYKRDLAITALQAALAEPQTTHWEGCEAVHPECRAKTELERKSDAIQRLWKERDELRTLNAELVGALRWYVDTDEVMEMEGNEFWLDGRERARAALAKVEASK